MKSPKFIMVIILAVMIVTLLGCSSQPTASPSATAKAPTATTSSAPAPAATTSAAPASTTPAAATSSAAPASSDSGKVITIRFAPVTAGPPPQMGLTLVTTNMQKLLESRTNGRVKFEIYWSETLAKGTELVSAVQNNIANAAMLRTFAEPGKIPLSTIGELPGVFSDSWAGLSAYTDLMKQDPILSELGKYKMKPVYATMILEQQLICRVPIRSLADLQGKKVAAAGVAAEIMKSLGAVPLAMSPVEQYDGLSKGTIDAISAPQDAIQAFKFYECGKYFVDVKTVPRLHPVVFNQGFWDSLPPDIQKIITDSTPDLIKSAYESTSVETAGAAWKVISSNVEVIKWSDADQAAVRKVTGAYADKWAADNDAKGIPASKALADYRSLAAKYEPLSPYKK